MPYFPHDHKIWGSGSIIITTRNSNMPINDYIPSENIIQVNELTKGEKLKLFTNIIGNISKENAEYLDALINKIPSFPLDVSHAAHYIKMENIPYNKYIEYITSKGNVISKLTHECLKDNSDYQNTRYNIIRTSLDNIISSNKDYKDLLLLINLIGSQNIPKELLEYYKGEVTTQTFINEMRKYSFVINNNTPPETFSIHPIMQEESFAYLNKKPDDSSIASLQSIARMLEKYLSQKLDGDDIYQLTLLNPHIEKFLNAKSLLQDIDKAPIYYKLGISNFQIGNYHKSKEMLELTDKIYQKHSPLYSIEQAIVKTRIGILYRNMLDYEQAKILLEDSFSIYKKYYGENHKDTAEMSIYLGSIYRNLGDYEKAKSLTMDGIRIL
ncbi:MAG UNVERIFIED_CONTAM: tetratricopeptide repeat protein [Rickettsiaceae bacterium]|jgi:hypothetical protein